MKHMSTALLVGIACVTGVGIALLILNYWSTTVCPEDSISTAEMEEYIASLDRRLAWAEKQIARTTAHSEKIVQYVQSRTLQLDKSELDALVANVQDEAIRLALVFQGHPAPPYPGFPSEPAVGSSNYASLEPFQIDDKWGGKEGQWDDVFYGGKEEEKEGLEPGNNVWAENWKSEPVLSDVEATKLCDEWKGNYSVVPGVSWGNLPFDLQQKWLHNSCDYHLTDKPAIKTDPALQPDRMDDDDIWASKLEEAGDPGQDRVLDAQAAN
jgi:hypothetical protein